MGKIVVWQKRSVIGEPESLAKVVRALGLRKMNKKRVHKDNNCIRGMINKVKHLVAYELVKD